MKLLDKVFTFNFLDRTSVSENQHQIFLTLASKLTYNSMKKVLKTIFSDKTYSSGDVIVKQCDNISIKLEGRIYLFDWNKEFKRKVNSTDKKGKITRFIISDSNIY